MRIHYTFVLSSSLITALYAAHNDKPDTLTFVTYSQGLSAPHTVDLNEKEAGTQKTFKELRDNAHKKGLPWAFSAHCLYDPSEAAWRYIDLIELLRDTHNDIDFCSKASVHKAIQNAQLAYMQKHYPQATELLSAIQQACYFSQEDSSMRLIGETAFGAGDTRISDTACCLAIALRDDYTPTSRLVGYLDSYEGDDHNIWFLKKFWGKVLQDRYPNTKKASD